MKVAAACHVHSNWSYDGSWTIADLATEFSRRGYRVLMMTEHDRGFTTSKLREHRETCQRASSKNILVISGMEYSEASNTVHLLTWGDTPFLGEGVPTTTVLGAVQEKDGIAVLAHPARRDAWRRFDSSWPQALLGIEIWNRKTDGWRPGARAAGLVNTFGLMPFAGLDFHERGHFFPLTMSLDLDGPLTEKSVLTCLKSRRCQPCAFGVPLRRGLVHAGMVALAPFELGRRVCAGLRRRLMATPANGLATEIRT